MLGRRQVGAILAGLRLLQMERLVEGTPPAQTLIKQDILDVLSDGGDFEPLNDDEIDALCYWLNTSVAKVDEIVAARLLHSDCGHVEIDDETLASRIPDDEGVWVLGWLWVPDDKIRDVEVRCE